MPDWTYQTLFKPALVRLPYKTARGLALGFMGTLGRLPFGPKVIDFFGHMRPAESLAADWNGVTFSTRLGLGDGFDPNLLASEALATFGFGFFDIGPVEQDGTPAIPRSITIDRRREEIWVADRAETISHARVLNWLHEGRHSELPVVIRLAQGHLRADWPWDLARSTGSNNITLAWSSDELLHLGSADRQEIAANHIDRSQTTGVRSLLVIPAILSTQHQQQVRNLLASGAYQGLVIDGSQQPVGCGRIFGRPAFPKVRSTTKAWRSCLGNDAWIISAGGIHEPWQALTLVDEGANLVEIDSGLVFSGPGLPKRINEAMERRARMLSQRDTTWPGRELPSETNKVRGHAVMAAKPVRVSQQGWFWTLLMGVSLLGGGLLALVIANTRVVMPYDEDLCGMTREQIAAVNNHLLDFMCHDRTTLASTMISLGVLYIALSWFGGRRGIHWAHASIIWSAFAGFFSFFLFLGFGYFDPLHAFVTAILFQFLLLALHSELPPRQDPATLDLHNDWRWKIAQWGQFLFIVQGLVLVTAGVVIATIGITTVFVETDLQFMQTTAESLWKAHPRLVPLIAHDRASFGGMLIASGLTVFLSSLWGFRRGHQWHWWGLVISANIAYLITLAVHLHVGYSSQLHLAPIYGGLAATWIAAGLAYPFLCDRRVVEMEPVT